MRAEATSGQQQMTPVCVYHMSKQEALPVRVPGGTEVKSSACISSHFKTMRINLVAQEVEHLRVFGG